MSKMRAKTCRVAIRQNNKQACNNDTIETDDLEFDGENLDQFYQTERYNILKIENEFTKHNEDLKEVSSVPKIKQKDKAMHTIYSKISPRNIYDKHFQLQKLLEYYK